MSINATIYKIQAQDGVAWKDIGLVVDYGADAAVRINHGVDLTAIAGSDYQAEDSAQSTLETHFNAATVAADCSHFGCPVRVSQNGTAVYANADAAEHDADARYNTLFPVALIQGQEV